MTIEEIEARKKELEKRIDEAKTTEELEELKAEVEAVNSEVPDEEVKAEEVKAEKVEEPVVVDERELIRVGSETITPIGNFKEERKMEKKYTRASEEYRNAWAKTLMGVELNEEEKRALGDAVGTTATTFVASAANTQGINNVGLFIPTSIILALNERAEEESPIWRDIRKYQVNGNVTVPYLSDADDAQFYVELQPTQNEGQEYKSIVLTGKELAKNVEITWKADQMTVEGFINYIVDELYEKMFKAKIHAVIYGVVANNEPAGIIPNATEAETATGDTPIDVIAKVKASLSQKAKKGAKVYISSEVADAIRFYKNENGNYPYLAGLPAGMEEDPYLEENEVVGGNMRNYFWNEQEDIRLDRDINMKGRTVVYGTYQVVDGAPKADSFAYATYTPSV